MPTGSQRLTSADELVAAVLAGRGVDRAEWDRLGVAAVHRAAASHDVLPLVADALSQRRDVPPELLAKLRADAAQSAAIDLAVEVELRRFLAEITGASVRPLFIKGVHLAYSHYDRSDLRHRVDSDLLIPSAARPLIEDVLVRRLGYQAHQKVSGEVVLTQKTYVKYDGDALVHAFDVHWKIASPPVFASMLSYEEMAGSAVNLPRLAAGAYAPCDIHALLLASVHRVAHHLDSMNFKWLYDIHLLARSLSDAQWDQFADLSADRRMGVVCRHSLEQSSAWFATPLPEGMAQDPRFTATDEVSAAYLAPRSPLQMAFDDLRVLPSWRERCRLVGEHLFPPAEYMRQLYAPSSRAPLPVLYALRAFRGARKWLRPSV